MRQRAAIPRETDARKRFGRFKKDEPMLVRTATVKERKTLQQLKKAFEEFCRYLHEDAIDDSERHGSRDIDREYHRKASQLVGGIRYTTKDVEGFSLSLAEFEGAGWQREAPGRFLSVLISNGHEKDYRIHVQDTAIPVAWLGSYNRKNIEVFGDVSDFFCYAMEGGHVTLHGNVCGGGAGQRMKNGTIVVEGNVLGPFGRGMEGGEVMINGKCDLIGLAGGHMKGGRIYHKGELVIDK